MSHSVASSDLYLQFVQASLSSYIEEIQFSNSKDSDQPANHSSLMRDFAVLYTLDSVEHIGKERSS